MVCQTKKVTNRLSISLRDNNLDQGFLTHGLVFQSDSLILIWPRLHTLQGGHKATLKRRLLKYKPVARLNDLQFKISIKPDHSNKKSESKRGE
jgi:hypothetical protein